MSLAALGFIILGGLCDNVFSDYLWARAVVLTSPTVATVGMSITIPFAMLSDFLLGNNKSGVPVLSLLGAGLVVLGFALVNFEPETLRQALCWGGSGPGSGSAPGSGSGSGPASSYSPFFQRLGTGGDSTHGGSPSREGFVSHIRTAYLGGGGGGGGSMRVKRTSSDDGDTDSETGLVAGASSSSSSSQHGLISSGRRVGV